MIEWSERKAYWRNTKVQMLTSLLPFLLVLIVLPLYADVLNDMRIFGIPLGYFLACPGLLIIACVTIAVVVTRPDASAPSHGAPADSGSRHRNRMAVASGARRLVNPRLGTFFGIFSAAFAALVLMALMLEQLGVADLAVRLLMFAGPIVLYGALGVLTPASDANDFFACGR